MTKRTQVLQLKLGLLLLLSLISVAAMAALWEFHLEGRVLPALGIPYDGNFEDAERWRFIITSTGFATLSLVIPGLIIWRLIISLSHGFLAILDARQEALRLARHDELTGLYNRRILLEKLELVLAGGGAAAAVMIIDLDRFKPINDTYGHAGGDDALCEIAARLRIFSSKSITVARIGGDEFAVLITEGIDRDELAALASCICTSLSQPLTSLPHRLSVGVSIGIAISPEDADTADALLRCADTAMYHKKAWSAAPYASMILLTAKYCAPENNLNEKFAAPYLTTSLSLGSSPLSVCTAVRYPVLRSSLAGITRARHTYA